MLEPYNEYSITKRIVKRPKIYFNDTGLASYLARINNPEALSKSIFSGRFIETYIINEIRKNFRNNSVKENFYYYRDNNQNEIDLVAIDKGAMHLIECKSNIRYGKSDVKAFNFLSKSMYQKGDNFIICNTPSVYKVNDDTYAVNISVI